MAPRLANYADTRLDTRPYKFLTAFVCLTAASSAFAETSTTTWQDFTSRCLDTFEHVFPADLDGLALTTADASDETWTDGTTTLRRDTIGGPSESYCAIIGPVDEAALAAWETEALQSGRYIDVTPDVTYAPHVLQSTEWREPRIEVVVVREGEQMVMVIETELES